MRTHYYTATSVDGFIADADNSLSWLFQFSDDPASDDRYASFVAGIGALVMGSTTYEWLLREEIRDDPSRWPYAQPTWVFTTRDLEPVPGADVRFVSGAVEPVHAEIAALLPEGQDLWLVGGGALVGMFAEAGLLDLVHLAIAPVVLGSGAPLLSHRLAEPPLVLEECRADGPFVQLRYRVQRG